MALQHAIGTTSLPAPQGTLMATLIKGILGGDLDWQFVLVGVFIAIFIELCGIKALSFAIGIYLPLATTLPIFIGGMIRGIVDRKKKKRGDLSKVLKKIFRKEIFLQQVLLPVALSPVLSWHSYLRDTGIRGGPAKDQC